MKHTLTALSISAIALASIVGTAQGDTIFDTGTPDGGFIGFYGFDIYVDQSVAIAFTPDQDYRLDQVGLWMMRNDFDHAGAPHPVPVGGAALRRTTTLGPSVIETSHR